MKIPKNFFIISLPTIAVLLLILELFFRTVIPAAEFPGYTYNKNDKMFCSSNRKENGLYTIGKFAQIRAKWRINNMNWNYPLDYYPIQQKKLIAVIGDSYIEAFQVDVDKNYPYLLREKLKTDYEVYAFGASGFPLSQYLHVSRYVNKYFHPSILIFNIVYNDFDESIYELRPSVYHFLQVSIGENGLIKETMPGPYFPVWGPVIAKSALLRYLSWNLHIGSSLGNLMNGHKKFEANICPDDVMQNKDLIFKGIDYLVKTIRAENSDKRIIFVMDAPRSAIYRNELDKRVLWINSMMKEICDDHKVEFIDLTPLMLQDYKSNHKKFESELDNHWNEYGHNFVANVLYDYINSSR